MEILFSLLFPPLGLDAFRITYTIQNKQTLAFQLFL